MFMNNTPLHVALSLINSSMHVHSEQKLTCTLNKFQV